MKTLKLIFLLFTFTALSCRSPGKKADQQSGPDTITPYVQADADLKLGEQLMKQGNAHGAAACVACHGAQGEGQAGSGFPRLTNQSRMYLSEQLHNYKEGRRNHAVMAPIAKAMNDNEIESVAAYLSQLPPAPTNSGKSSKVSKTLIQRGREIAEVGDSKLSVQSCANCHGPGGIGQPPAIPALKGQYASYLQAQLLAWKSDARTSSADRMGLIAKLLTEEDIKAVTAYFESLPGSESEKSTAKKR